MGLERSKFEDVAVFKTRNALKFTRYVLLNCYRECLRENR
jgi:hypothetical protein